MKNHENSFAENSPFGASKNENDGEIDLLPYMNETSLSSSIDESHQHSVQNTEKEKEENNVPATGNINDKKAPSLSSNEDIEVTTEGGYSESSTYEASDLHEASEKESSSQSKPIKDEFSILNIVREEGPNILADMFNVIKESVQLMTERKEYFLDFPAYSIRKDR